MGIPALDAALAVEGVSVSFGGVQALTRVSLQLQPGEIVGIIGPNGAGKTTLFDCISGHLDSVGRVWLGGREITALSAHRRATAGLGRSFQDARLFPTLTVRETFLMAAERRSRRDAPGEANRIVELMGLSGYAHKFVRELSTGTRRIVDLGCLLIQRPAVVLFDEPSSGIAQREAEALGPMLRSIRDETGAGLLVIEHDMPLLLGVADRIYALETGRVIAEGSPADVVRAPEVVRSYLGSDLVAIERSGSLARVGA
jgi:branched-chain amino acid transport system ATP-binding protein